jgi:hypothetical protein
MLRCTAVALVVVYLGWNAWWLSQAAIPPSLLTGLTGLPCPTTGGVRSLRMLWQGDVWGSLRMNAMAAPMTILFLLSAIWPIAQAACRRRPSLPSSILWCWAAVLAVAWAWKLLGVSQFW